MKLSEEMEDLVSNNPFATLADAYFIDAISQWAKKVAQLEADVARLTVDKIQWRQELMAQSIRLADAEAEMKRLRIGLLYYAEYDLHGKPLNHAAEVLTVGGADVAG